MSTENTTRVSALEVIASFLDSDPPLDKVYATPQEAAAALIGRLIKAGYGLQLKDRP
jgi:hypothetical protein